MLEVLSREDRERIVALEKELSFREADDPLKLFKPNPKQQKFVDAVLKEGSRFTGFFGANRSGKSSIGAYVGSNLARFGPERPKSIPHEGASIQVRDRATSGWVISLDSNTSRDVIEPKYFDNGFCPPGGQVPFIPRREIVEWRSVDGILKLKNGSLIGFKSCEAGAQKVQGAGKDWIHFDEEPPQNIYEEAVIRVEAGRSLSVFMTCTLLPPVGQVGGVSWVYPKIIKPFQEKKSQWKLFGASIYDNPHIGADEVRALETIFPLETPGGRIRLLGEWLPGIGGSRAYPSFNSSIHVRPQPHPLERRPLCFIWDFNVEPLVTLVGQRQENLFRVFTELVLEEGNIPDMCQMFYERFGGHRGEIYVYGDSTGQGRTAQYGKSDYATIQNELRRNGINVRMKVPPKNPLVVDRVSSMNRVLKNEQGLACIEIDESCNELITDLEQVLLDPRGGIKKSHNIKDTYYRRTHSSDALGYWVTYEAPVRVVTPTHGNVVSIRDVAYSFK